MLGPGQFQWLLEGLTHSAGRFKMLGSGSSLSSNPLDDWSAYSWEKKQLLRALGEHRVGGVMYLSGDIHVCKVKRHRTQKLLGYRLYEVVSSGIANLHRIWGEQFGFVVLEFDTTAADPTVRIRIRHGNGVTTVDRVLKLSELQPAIKR